jgi:hypothetical protein
MAGDDDFMEITLDTPVEINGTQNLWITFYQSGLDYPADGCAGPTDPNGRWVSLDGETWTDIANYGFDYTWMIRAGFGDVQTEWVSVNDAVSPQTINGLTPQTDYMIRLRAVCGGEDGESVWVMTTFTTLEACPVPTDVAVNVDASTATVTWTGFSDSYNVQLGQPDFMITEDFNHGIPTDWANSSDYPWTISQNGNYIQSSNAGVSSSESTISATATYPEDGTIAFDAECMGEGTGTAWDKCIFTIDGVEQFAYGANVSGWKHYSFDVAAGEHTFTWSYTKDGSVNPTGDYMAIDNVVMISNNFTWADEAVEADEAEYTFEGLTPGTNYCVRVQGVCDNNPTEWSEVATFTTLPSIELVDNEDNSATIRDNDGVTAEVTLSGRTLWKDNAWNTLTLPFDMTEEQVTAQLAPTALMELSNDVTETFNDHPTGVTDDGTLYLVFKDATEITAGVPYIIKWDGDGSDNLVNPVFTGVTIDNASLEDNAVTFNGGKFIGTYTYTEYTEENQSILFLSSKEEDERDFLYWPLAGAKLGAFRAYFQMDEGTKIRSFRVSYGQNAGEATGIISAKVSGDARDSWYTVDGVKLNGAPKRKGLYIHNGVKVVIK